MGGHKTLLYISLGMGVLLAALFYFWGADAVWSLWCVPAKAPGFADLRDVLQGIESVRNGTQNVAGSSFGLIGGYPPIWALLGWLGLGVGSTVGVAVALFCGFAVSLHLFARRLDSLAAVLISVVVFSPAAMLGYERANLDLAMFVILSAALSLVSISSMLSVALVFLAGMLKIFPILGMGYLLRQARGKFLLWGGVVVAAFIVYMLILGRGAQGILSYIPKGDTFAYGASVLGIYVYRMGASKAALSVVVLTSFVILYLASVAILFISYKRGAHEPLSRQESPYLDAFRLGAFIYIGTFVQGNSFNYRFIFLIFCIPQLLVWARQPMPVYREARASLVALLVACWGAVLLRFLPEALALGIKELANWILFAGLFYLLAVSLPDWLFCEVQRFFEKYDRRRLPVTP